MRSKITALVTLTVLIGVAGAQVPQKQPSAGGAQEAEPARAERVVFLGGGLSDENVIALTANIAASGHPGVVLLDTPQSSPHVKLFLAKYRPERVVPVGSFPAGINDLERRLGMSPAPIMEWKQEPPAALWKLLFPRAERVVVCAAEPRRLLLQAACLAGSLQVPLIVTRGGSGEVDYLRRLFMDWGTREIFAIGTVAEVCRGLTGAHLTALNDKEAVTAANLEYLHKKGAVQTLVVANPADTQRERGGMSSLAPWIAVQRRAALLLTNDKGDNATAVVRAALKNPGLRDARNLLLVGNLRAIPMERRPNPAAGKDAEIAMEPLTPSGSEPFTFATGRLVHEDPGVVTLVLARQRLLKPQASPTRALVVSNPGGGLPLLETFSRNTVKELRNGGYQTTALFGKEVTKDGIRRLLPEQNVFLWEGHYKTLIDQYGLPTWSEPLQPSLVFLQSCLALNETEAQPLLQRGAIALVGSSTRTYSASGGAFTLAFFDSLLYEDQTLGGAMRHAKNFLLTYSLLKEKRLGKNASLGGANVRSAWSFTLWGDPTLKWPRPESLTDALSPVRHNVHDNTIVVSLPETAYEKVTVGRYEAQMLPNARLAGLLTKEMGEDVHHLVPFIFLEVHLPKVPPDKTPRLRSKLSDKQWVFCWDARGRSGSLLLIPGAKDKKELRFEVEWDEERGGER